MSATHKLLADYFMRDYFGLLVAAAPRRARVGARFLWVLWGEVEGKYLMTLTNDVLAVEPVDCEPQGRIDGVIEWKQSIRGIEAYLRGAHGLTAAYDSGELVVHSDRVGKQKLGRAIEALNDVDFARVHNDLEQHVFDDVMASNKVGQQPRMVRASRLRQAI